MGTGWSSWMKSARKCLSDVVLALSHIILCSLCLWVTASITRSLLRIGKWVCRLLKTQGLYLQRVMGL